MTILLCTHDMGEAEELCDRVGIMRDGRIRTIEGAHTALLDGASVQELWSSVRILLVMGAVFVPLGIWIFHLGESYAKRTGKLKRSG